MVELITASFCAGTAVSAGTLAYLLLRLTGAERYRDRLRSLVRQGTQNLPTALERWAARAGKGMRWEIAGPQGVLYAAFLVAMVLAGAVLGFVYLANPLAAVVMAAAGAVFPEQIRRARRRAFREKVIEQLGAAIRVFAAEYSDTPHPVKALSAAAQKLPDPVGGILKQAASSLVSAKNSDDVDTALIRMGRELSGEYGKMFVQLLRLSFEDEAVKPLFARLAARVTAQQDLVRKNRLETTMDRLLALLLNLAVVPVYFVIVRTLPEAGEFFRTTAAGKGVVALCFFSAVMGGLLDIVFGGADDD